MQRLYENHKVLTYPRTDSRYIGKDVVPTIKERLQACGTGPYRKLAGALANKPIQANASFVDDKKSVTIMPSFLQNSLYSWII